MDRLQPSRYLARSPGLFRTQAELPGLHAQQDLSENWSGGADPQTGGRMNVKSLLDRFCRYVRIDTQADEAARSYPSSAGQLELGKLVAGELRAMGIAD